MTMDGAGKWALIADSCSQLTHLNSSFLTAVVCGLSNDTGKYSTAELCMILADIIMVDAGLVLIPQYHGLLHDTAFLC